MDTAANPSRPLWAMRLAPLPVYLDLAMGPSTRTSDCGPQLHPVHSMSAWRRPRKHIHAIPAPAYFRLNAVH